MGAGVILPYRACDAVFDDPSDNTLLRMSVLHEEASQNRSTKRRGALAEQRGKRKLLTKPSFLWFNSNDITIEIFKCNDGVMSWQESFREPVGGVNRYLLSHMAVSLPSRSCEHESN